jgi:type II secretory pathway pseudopilin PulG
MCQHCKRFVRAARASEFAVCVLFLVILSAAIVPQFSQASGPSRERTLADLLRYMRTQVQVYQDQHGGRAPGLMTTEANLPPDSAAFIAQMTQGTDAAGRLVPAHSPRLVFGPYLSGIPENPFTLQGGILVVPGRTFPPPDNSQPYGWMYSPGSGRLIPNLEGVGPNGVPYVDY